MRSQVVFSSITSCQFWHSANVIASLYVVGPITSVKNSLGDYFLCGCGSLLDRCNKPRPVRSSQIIYSSIIVVLHEFLTRSTCFKVLTITILICVQLVGHETDRSYVSCWAVKWSVCICKCGSP